MNSYISGDYMRQSPYHFHRTISMDGKDWSKLILKIGKANRGENNPNILDVLNKISVTWHHYNFLINSKHDHKNFYETWQKFPLDPYSGNIYNEYFNVDFEIMRTKFCQL